MSCSHVAMMLPTLLLLAGIPLASSEGLRLDSVMEPVAVAAGSPPPTVAKKIVLHSVDFDENGPGIRPDAVPVLNEAVQLLSTEQGMIVIVPQPAASTVSAVFSRILGSRRAKAVRRYLVDHGIAASRIRIENFDELPPPASSTTTDNQSLGVELQID
jgi:outer membrane protein OmpA-like peptidoglycan-associated protein